jgi:CheY-like chemotaxis protein
MSGIKTILIVDDDSTVLDLLTRALSGYRVWAARDPDEGLRIARGLPLIDLLITDFMMPEMTGDELLARVRALRPSVKVMILTGHSDLLDTEGPSWWTGEAHLAKPVELRAVRTMVANLIGPPAAPDEKHPDR